MDEENFDDKKISLSETVFSKYPNIYKEAPYAWSTADGRRARTWEDEITLPIKKVRDKSTFRWTYVEAKVEPAGDYKLFTLEDDEVTEKEESKPNRDTSKIKNYGIF